MPKRSNRDHIDAFHKRRLWGITFRHIQSRVAQCVGHIGDGHHAAHVTQRSIEREFPDEDGTLKALWRDLFSGSEDAHRDWEIVRGPFLAHLGRRQVYEVAPHWKVKTGILERTSYTFTTFLHSSVRQTDDSKAGHSP